MSMVNNRVAEKLTDGDEMRKLKSSPALLEC